MYLFLFGSPLCIIITLESVRKVCCVGRLVTCSSVRFFSSALTSKFAIPLSVHSSIALMFPLLRGDLDKRAVMDIRMEWTADGLIPLL